MSLRRKEEVEEENGEKENGEKENGEKENREEADDEADGEEEDVDGEEEDVEVSGDVESNNTIIVSDSSDDNGAISDGSVQVKKYLSFIFQDT